MEKTNLYGLIKITCNKNLTQTNYQIPQDQILIDFLIFLY